MKFASMAMDGDDSQVHLRAFQVSYVSMLCYNFGVSTYHDKQFQVCTVWLRESYDLGKERGSVAAKYQVIVSI